MIEKTFGHYHILEKIGRGGMGEVFLADDTLLHRKVALKFLPAEMQQDPSAQRRFFNEAKSAAALDHPYICHINEFGEGDGKNFIVMEYVDGQTLKDRLASEPLQLTEAIQIASEIAEALEEAHKHGIVHRDLKPANVMITQNGHAKVMDFGLAKQLIASDMGADQVTATTQTGAILGTLDYMSPEQLQGKPIDTRSDIFSFGIVLYEMLTGVHPFKQSSAIKTASSILTETLQPLDRHRPGLPIQLQDILEKLLAKDPLQRYQSIEDLLIDLRPSQIKRYKRYRHLNLKPRLLAVLGTALFVAALLAGLLWYLFWPANPAIAFQERDWIVAVDFENETGESVFDKSLDTALRVSLEQSSFVNLLPRSRIEQTLRRMKKPGDSRIDEPLAREIAQREGINVLLVPSITGIAGTYMLSATLEDAGSGTRIKSEAVRVRGKEEVLAALDQLTRSTRRSLGETYIAISRRAKQLAEVTTASLEALKQYSLGLEAHKAGRFEQARTYYENALALDPNFVLATASLGFIDFEQFDKEKGKQLLSKAAGMTGNLTDREKYGVMAAYARAVENDIPKTIQYWKVLSGMYPDDATIHNNLGWFYRQIGKYDEAIREYKEALRIDRYLMLSYNSLIEIYLYRSGQATAAVDLCSRAIAVDERSFWAHLNLGWAYLGTGDLERARAAMEKALQLSDNPQAEFPEVGNPYKNALYRIAHSFRLQKKYAEALRVLQRIPEMFTDPEADYEIGVVCQLMQDPTAARNHFAKYRKHLIEKTTHANRANAYDNIQLALVCQRLGLDEEALSAFQKATVLDPQQHFEFAQYFSVAGRSEDALRELELAIQKGETNFIWMKIHPDFESLYGTPRFQALVKQHVK